jgi:cobalt-zinc-cadmium efflux system protein
MSAGHAHGHDDGGGTGGNRRRPALVLALTTSVLVIQVVGALASGSLALLTGAAHAGHELAAHR